MDQERALAHLKTASEAIYPHIFVTQNLAQELQHPRFWLLFLYASDELDWVKRFNFALDRQTVLRGKSQQWNPSLDIIKSINLAKPPLIAVKSAKYALINLGQTLYQKRVLQAKPAVLLSMRVAIQCLFLPIEAPLAVVNAAIDYAIDGIRSWARHGQRFIQKKIKLHDDKNQRFKRFSHIGLMKKTKTFDYKPMIEFFSIGEASLFEEKVLSPLDFLTTKFNLPKNEIRYRMVLRHDFSPEKRLIIEELCKANHDKGWFFSANQNGTAHVIINDENGGQTSLFINEDHLSIIDSVKHSHILYDAVAKLMRAMGIHAVGICNNNNRIDSIVFAAERLVSNGLVFVLENKFFSRNKATYQDVVCRAKNPRHIDMLKLNLRKLQQQHGELYAKLPPALRALEEEVVGEV